ncbi:hypothetical protein BJ878DRAFT_544522 [Calycina marina]|uniref:Uncharacterized protein n=1 Tax=Calycina marina TaxID=1763456 RepID=A0A9P7YYI2_9HELO|nr:hypothetical protein BJ878DRAFT_544522 [Calycina marina]
MSGVKLGFVIQLLGFKFTFGICASIYAGISPIMYFFLPENVYFAPIAKTEVDFDKVPLNVYEIIIPEINKTPSQRLAVSQGWVSKALFWRVAFKSLPLVTFLAVIFSAIIYSVF